MELATQLSRLTAQLSQLQLDLGGAIKREAELKQQLQNSQTSDRLNTDDLSALKLQLEGMEFLKFYHLSAVTSCKSIALPLAW